MALRSAHPQQQVAVRILRDGQARTLQVQLAQPPPQFSIAPPVPPVPPIPPIHIPEIHIPPIHIPPMPPVPVNLENWAGVSEMRAMSLGMSVETMPEQLAGYFGVKQGQQAVLVRSVTANSVAGKAGFRAGDVILRLNHQAVHSVSDFWKSLSAARGKAASVGVLRHGRPVTVKIAAVPSDAGFRMPDRKELQRQIAEAQREFNSPQFRKQMEDIKKQAAAAAEQWRKQAEQMRLQGQQWQ
jgi:membrane-associated protease RseP (regulator of RpoE activity)